MSIRMTYSEVYASLGLIFITEEMGATEFQLHSSDSNRSPYNFEIILKRSVA